MRKHLNIYMFNSIDEKLDKDICHKMCFSQFNISNNLNMYTLATIIHIIPFYICIFVNEFVEKRSNQLDIIEGQESTPFFEDFFVFVNTIIIHCSALCFISILSSLIHFKQQRDFSIVLSYTECAHLPTNRQIT